MLRRVCGKSPHVSAMLLKHVIFPSIERDGLVMHVNSDLWARELLGVACEKPGSDFGWLGSDLWAHELLGVACEWLGSDLWACELLGSVLVCESQACEAAG